MSRVTSEPRITVRASSSPRGFAISNARLCFVGRSSAWGWYSMWSVMAMASRPSRQASSERTSGQTAPSEKTVWMWRSHLSVR